MAEDKLLPLEEQTEGQIAKKTLTLEEQKQLRSEATNKIDEICGKCQLILDNRKKLNNKGAYNYCVRECPVGKELQIIGKKLLEARGFDEEMDESTEDGEEIVELKQELED